MTLKSLLEKDTVIPRRLLSDTINKTKIKEYIDEFEPNNTLIKQKKKQLMSLYKSFVATLDVDHLGEILPKTLVSTKSSVISVSSLIDKIDKQANANKEKIAIIKNDNLDYMKLQRLANYVHKIGKTIFE